MLHVPLRPRPEPLAGAVALEGLPRLHFFTLAS